MDKLFLAQNFLAKAKYNYGYNYDSDGFFGGFLAFLFWLFFMASLYVYSALTLMLIAKKTNTSNAWMAWIPILNLYLAIKIAGKSIIWLLLFLLPFVNIVAAVVIWAAIAERRGKPAWWGLLMLLPIINLVIIGLLAFGGGTGKVSVVSVKKKGGPSCPKCGASISSSDKFCQNCGAKIVEKKKSGFCSKCGAGTKPSDKFCPECGAKL